MPQISIEELSIGFRGPLLLDGVSAHIERGQRIGLLGRNGSGKTTLLRILDGIVQPDHGNVIIAPGTRIARLTQDVPDDLSGSVTSVVMSGQPHSDDAEDEWKIHHAVESTLSRMKLDGDADFVTLSSGMKRRVLLARAIASQPTVLLLDEPTNHLDVPSILWLEEFLSGWKETLMFITHDRSFLKRLATRIWEIDRGRLFDWSCDYETFLSRKELALAAEEKQNALFDRKLAEEEVWIRQGIKARRTRNEGRVRALKAMRNERAERRSDVGKARLKLQEADRSGTLVAEAKKIAFSYDGVPVIRDFSTTLMRGDKIGMIGPNGVGKTTLLRLLLGELEPDAGSVRIGTNVQVAYFDQVRDTLDPNKTVQENVGDGSDRLQFGDQVKHIIGYLQEFLFTPERARTEVRFLSGGECNRALLAKLMTQPANVIVLDEPTNDLDAETLELLEEQLVQFQGTLLMVSHDRTFLNNVVTSTIVFEEDGINEYVGGYDDWQAALARREEDAANANRSKSGTSRKSKPSRESKPVTVGKKLSFNEKRELDQLPKRIESLETEIATMHLSMADPGYYQQSGDAITEDAAALKQAEQDLETAYARLETLDS